MKIKQILSQHRRDFTAIYVCEHCDHTHTSGGYDGSYFHQSVVPNMVCPSCDKKALGTNYLMVWERVGVESITNEYDNEWDWSTSRLYALRPDGELLFFWNTELGGMDHV